MDTPINNNNVKIQPCSTSISKFEDSPVFNYISTLSPIKQFRLNHSGQSFPLLSFTSPQSLQTPPPNNCLKESNVTSVNHALDASLNACSQDDSKGGNVDTSDTLPPCDLHSENKDRSDLGRDVYITETAEPSKLAKELPIVKYECVSPENISVVGKEMVPQETESLPENQIDMHRIEVEHNKEVSEWEKFISNAAEIFNCESPTNETNYEDQPDDNDDSGSLCFIKEFLQTPNENIDDLKKIESICPLNSSVNHGGVGKADERSQVSSVRDCAVLSEEVFHHSKTELDEKQQQTSRRCLIYEMSGSRYRKVLSDFTDGAPVSTTIASPNASNEKCIAAGKQGSSKTASVLPGIGLHLNALAATGRDKIIVKRENMTCRRQLLSAPSTMSSFDSRNPDMESLNPPLGSEVVEKACEVLKDDTYLNENVCENSSFGDDGIGVSQSSPRKKRKKDNDGDADSCKRCNCKKSKCLKLYCECFAAGLYCVEPCNCQECFNKPAHEDIVLETRRQIESRNPLAFAPKVIVCSGTPNSVSELKKTPASARHKRGCNCKKSGCLKKYCECFQGGVGCSLSCRCEGCKNMFGQKEGVLFEEANILHKSAHDATSLDDVSKTGHENQETLEPSNNERQLVRRPFHFDGTDPQLPLTVQPLQSCKSQKNDDSNPTTMVEKHELVTYDEDSEFSKGDDYLLPATDVKSTSPNCKRISSQNHVFEKSTGWKSCRKLILRSIPSLSTASKEQESSKAQGKLL